MFGTCLETFILFVYNQCYMTKLGEYLTAKLINQTKVATQAGLRKTRLNQLINNPSTKLLAEELYAIAVAIGVDPGELLEYVCGGKKKLK